MTASAAPRPLTLVLAASGKTGRRVADRLEALGVPTRRASRSTATPFDWNDRATWPAALRGVEVAYVVYTPDLAVPAAPAAIEAFTDLARRSGVRRLVLLSGRGEEEAQRCERIVQASGLEWTVVRANWFSQNFSEGEFRDAVSSGVIALPAGDVAEPFVDVDDIADVAVAALTEEGHTGEVYEVSGPRALTFAEVARELTAATGREIVFQPVPMSGFTAGLSDAGLPADQVWLLEYLFNTVLDGRNTPITDGVERALGRPAKDFAVFAAEQAAAGTWTPIAEEV